jgi:hypothetical protein
VANRWLAVSLDRIYKLMKLETQLEKLAELGLSLNEGITIDDLLYSLDRSTYEANPFDDILHTLGIEVEREPWGRRMCDRVWNFDTECIYSTGDYVSIVKRLCLLTGNTEIVDINDFFDLEANSAWLEYTIDGRKQRHAIEINSDWADTLTLTYVMEDLQQDGKQFYTKDNGQAMLLFYLDRDTAIALNDLCDDALEPIIPA